MKHISVAIDGPVGAGKSTVARECARRLGFIYCDTGALYRAVGLYCVENGADLDNPREIAGALGGIKAEIRLVDGTQHVYLNGRDVSEKIRLPEISMAASAVSAVAEVRAALLGLQRKIAANNDVIMDGRDIGTVVLPDADVKIFLTASPEKRAERRYAELREKGEKATLAKVLDEMRLRDRQDTTRDIAPLRCAPDAVRLDTSDMTLDESEEAILRIVRGKLG